MTFLSRITAAVKSATGGGKPASGGGGQLPPVAPPKVKNKQVSYPGFVTTIRPTGAILQRVDPNLANVDIAATFRNGQTSQATLRSLARANPDLAAALSAYIRVGIPEKYIAIARNPDGTVNDDATRLAFEVLQRFDKLPAYDAGFSTVASVRSTSEALAKEGMLYGAMAMELVLDKGRLPYTFQPIFVPSVQFYQDEQGAAQGLKPVQNVGGTYIDLDMPTFFMAWLDPNLNDPYPQGPFESAIQAVLMSAQFLTDMRRVMARHVYPRYDVTLLDEKLRAAIPPEVLNDPDSLPGWMNKTIADIEDTIQNLGPEEAIVHFDFIEVKYIENSDGQGDSQKFQTIKDIVDANLAKGAKVMPAVLGNGSGSQNVASTETLLFTMSANSMVRLKLQELYSRALTLAVRLFGQDVTVEFEFDEIELRPETELASFRSQQLDVLTRKYALGMIGPMEFCLRAHGYPAPPDFTDEHGTVSIKDLLAIVPPPDAGGNGYSGTGAGGGQSGGGAATQSRKPATPAKSRGTSKQ
jgi:hypothetical protein